MKENTVILIDNKVENLELMEEIIRRVDPGARHVSFIYADEAPVMINHEMITPPSHIFIDAALKRVSISHFLETIRSNKKLNSCCITVFSDTMPVAVAEIYCSIEADFAFSRPLTITNGVDLLQCILPATRRFAVESEPTRSYSKHHVEP